ncbi:MAG TPA: XdhC family protein [Micromonosporaceae bacterium]|jgi:xanthine dehydrogenase accessory factor
MSTDLLARADGLRTERTPFVLATVVRAQRPTSAKAGDRAIVLSDGTIEGFVGGACAESTVRAEGMRLFATGESTLLRITPEPDPPQPADEGLVVVGNPCLSGGTLEIFLEPVLPPVLVYVFGVAPIARALMTVGAAVGYDIRAGTDPAAPIPPDAAAVVIASHGRDEERVIVEALRAGVPYVGLVASRKRGAAVLAALDVPDELRERVRTPAGLDLGARTPTEVALSVLAEVVQRRAARSAAEAGPVPPSAPLPSLAVAETATDPVCGMTVAAIPASLHLEHAGRTWYFCGAGCRQAFADDPGRYGG